MDKEQTPTTDFKRNLAIEIIARFIGNSRGLPIARREFINGAEWGHNQALAAFKKRLKAQVVDIQDIAHTWPIDTATKNVVIHEYDRFLNLIDETK